MYQIEWRDRSWQVPWDGQCWQGWLLVVPKWMASDRQSVYQCHASRVVTRNVVGKYPIYQTRLQWFWQHLWHQTLYLCVCVCVYKHNTNKPCYYFVKRNNIHDNLQRSFKSPFLTAIACVVVASRFCWLKHRGCWRWGRLVDNGQCAVVVVVATRRRGILAKAILDRQETFLKHWNAIGIMPGKRVAGGKSPSEKATLLYWWHKERQGSFVLLFRQEI